MARRSALPSHSAARQLLVSRSRAVQCLLHSSDKRRTRPGSAPVLFAFYLWCNAGMEIGQFKTVALVGRTNTPGIEAPLRSLAEHIANQGFEVVFEEGTAKDVGVTEYPALSIAEIGARADVAVVL